MIWEEVTREIMLFLFCYNDIEFYLRVKFLHGLEIEVEVQSIE